MAKRVLVPLADGCEEIEAVTVIDILRRAEIEVVAAGLAEGVVTASRGVRLQPDAALDAVLGDSFDMLVLPGGGPGAERLQKDERILRLAKTMQEEGRHVAAICAAPKVLVTAGVLDNRRATSYPGHIDRNPAPGMTYVEEPVVVDGKVVTSRGPGTAMDFALTLVELLAGPEKRRAVEAGLQRPR